MSVTPLNPDAAWYLYAAERVLQGSELYVDLTDPNPPLVFYLSTLPVFLASVFDASPMLVFKFAVLMTALMSFLLSMYVVRHADLLPAGWQREAFRLALPFVFLVYVEGDAGQREHFFLLLALPYVLLSAARANGRTAGRRVGLIIGVFAGIGLALKPHFLLVWLATDVYLWHSARQPPWRRIEALALGLVLAGYGGAIALLTPAYFDVVDVAGRVYHAYNAGSVQLVTRSPIALWLVALGAFLLSRGAIVGRRTSTMLMLSSTACLLAALLQHKGWRYHFYPANAMALLVVVVCVPQLTREFRWLRPVRARPATRSMAAAVLVATALVIQQGPGRTALTIIQSTVDAAYATRWDRGAYRDIVSAVRRETFGGTMTDLIEIVRTQAAAQPVVLLSTSVWPTFPLVNYSGATWPLRFNCLWMLPGSYPLRPDTARYHAPAAMDAIERELFEHVVETLVRSPPTLLIVDQRRFKQGFGGMRFDYIEYFSQDARFVDVFRQYELLRSVDGYGVYKKR